MEAKTQARSSLTKGPVPTRDIGRETMPSCHDTRAVSILSETDGHQNILTVRRLFFKHADADRTVFQTRQQPRPPPLPAPLPAPQEGHARMTYAPSTPPPAPPRQDPHAMTIEAVTICVDYADFLSWFLLANTRHFDRLVVVTDTRDAKTAALCEHYAVECIRTDAFYEGGQAFNKGAGINAGLAALKKDAWAVHLDCDIILPPRTRPLIQAANLDPTMIYGVDRMLCQSFEDWISYIAFPEVQHAQNIFINGRAFPLATRVGALWGDGYVPIGYFQLWNPRASNRYTYENHCDAGRGDFAFATSWPRAKRALLPEILAVHLESEKSPNAMNWRGRRSKPFGPPARSYITAHP
jgi:hypothetical protein